MTADVDARSCLYQQLVDLCNRSDIKNPFYYVDQELDGAKFRIFSYRFIDSAAWALSPVTRQCRGIMYDVTDIDNPVCVCRPVHKFFNIGEPVPGQEYTEPPVFVMNKVDGSLISSYRHPVTKRICLKSKTSVQSDFAREAQLWLSKHSAFYNFLDVVDSFGWTVNMELVHPNAKFRIVVYYQQPQLIVLNARDRSSGRYMDFEFLKMLMSVFLGDASSFTGQVDASMVAELDSTTGIEGYVVIDANRNWWKKKSRWYLERHRAKDILNQPRSFIELVICEEADDVTAMFQDQLELAEFASRLETQTVDTVNSIVNSVTGYYLTNRELSRKDYAIQAQATLGNLEFTLAMMFYVQQSEPNWKEFFIKKVDKILERINTANNFGEQQE